MWQTVELREIRVFLTLAEELHFGRTAERLSLTQSRVSQTLRGLETRLGSRLLNRTSRRVALTPEGEQLRDELGPAYRELLGVLGRFSHAREVMAGVVRLGVSWHGAIGPRLLRAIDTFEALHSECQIETEELPFRDRLAPLREGKVDLMIARLPIDQPDIELGPEVSIEPRVVAVARDHPLAALGSISIEDLAEHRVPDLTDLGPKEIGAAYVPETAPSGRPIERLGVRIRDFSDLVILIARGRVVQPTVASATPRFAHANVVCLPIVDMPPSRSALAWRRGASDPRLLAFVAIVRQTLSTASR